MEKRPNVLAVACTAQAHVRLFLQFCYKIAAQGIKVPFVNTEFPHSNIIAAKEEFDDDGVILAWIPEGLQEINDRIDPLKVIESFKRVMHGHLMVLINTRVNTKKYP